MGWGKGCMRFWGRMDQSSVPWQHKAPIDLQWGKWCLHFFLVFYPILFILAGNEDMHKISDEFEFRPDRTTDYGVSCPWGLKKSHRLIMGKWCLNASSFIFDRIIIKVAGNQDRHKSSDEFDFGPLVSMAHLYVFGNEIWPWHIGLRCAIVALWATCLSIPQVGKGYVRLDLSALVLNVWSLLCYDRIRSYATLIAYELHVQQYSLGYGVFEC